MSALFPQWANGAVRFGLGLIVLVILGVPTALIIYVRTPYVTDEHFPVVQPVMFDHRHHVTDDGIDCRYCHDTVERSPFAGVPPTARCMGCHSQVYNNSPQLAKVRESWFLGTPIRWQRVHELPDFVYFDHSIHVTRGIGCVSCHGRVDRMAQVEQVQPLTMGWCLRCHRAPEKNLRPRDQITSMTWTPKPGETEELARAYGTRHVTYCTGCHR